MLGPESDPVQKTSFPPSVSLSKTDWDLHRKGPADQARHNEKVKEAIKGGLAGIIGEESIITADGDKIIKVPVRSLELPHFRFSQGNGNRAGQGQGGTKVGDVIGHEHGQAGSGPGRGKGAGQEPGIDYYEAEMTIDELAELVCQDLELPNLKEKGKREVESEVAIFKDRRRVGPLLDKKATLRRALDRMAKNNEKTRLKLINDDVVKKTYEMETKFEKNAVVVAMRDVSGSMGEFEKYITRSFYFWMVRFLRTKYKNVKIVFITHHTEAQEVIEEAFFNLGESGGTKVSSAYQLALEIVDERFDPTQWNIYPFHFSDGDNWGEVDNQRCLELVRQLLDKSNVFGYGEIQEGGRRSLSILMSTYKPEMDKNPAFIGVTIANKDEVYPALQTFFKTRPERSLPK